MRSLLRLLILFQLLLSFNIQLVMAEDIDLSAGEQIFTQNCIGCHAGGNNVISIKKTLKQDALDENKINTVEAITRQVTNGNPAGMPAFGERLSEDDIKNVASYVLNQAKIGWD